VDDEAFRPPVPGNFASKACNHGASEKIAEPVVTRRRRYDIRTSALCPGNNDGFSMVRTMDLDTPGRSRERAILLWS
jgi:hypothetical protein